MIGFKRLTIFAGVNGSGKTTLYHSGLAGGLFTQHELGERINLDEIAAQTGTQGSYFPVDAGKQAYNLFYDCLDQEVSMNIETTLTGKSIHKRLHMARRAGFQLHMYYFGLESADLAIKRVHHRVRHGGHSIPDDVIKRRYASSL